MLSFAAAAAGGRGCFGYDKRVALVTNTFTTLLRISRYDKRFWTGRRSGGQFNPSSRDWRAIFWISMASDVNFTEFFPGVPSWNYMFMLEAMTYKAVVDIPLGLELKPENLCVQVWTSQCDRHNSEGVWHAIDLPYNCSYENRYHSFGTSEIITSDKDFNFTFRMKCPLDKDWRWSHGWGQDGFTHVEPPRDGDQWTKGPDYDHILGVVHLGNFIAATNATECGFTHVLNVADNLDMVYSQGTVNYLKVPMRDGAINPIDEEKVAQAVDFLLKNDFPQNKILVNCRAGIGRAGSMAVAFVFAKQRWVSYEDAYNHVYARRFVYPHSRLKDTLYKLYPRDYY